MTPLVLDWRQAFVGALREALPHERESIDAKVRVADLEHGDFTFRHPDAASLATKVQVPGLLLSVKGVFLNARRAA